MASLAAVSIRADGLGCRRKDKNVHRSLHVRFSTVKRRGGRPSPLVTAKTCPFHDPTNWPGRSHLTVPPKRGDHPPSPAAFPEALRELSPAKPVRVLRPSRSRWAFSTI